MMEYECRRATRSRDSGMNGVDEREARAGIEGHFQ
jgi:hypothetical protein